MGAASAAVLATASHSIAAAYEFTALNSVVSPRQSNGLAINAGGEVVGAFLDSPSTAAYSNNGSPLQTLGPASGSSTASAVNSGGIAAGYFTSDATQYAFYSDTTVSSPVLTPLPTAIAADSGGASASYAYGVSGTKTSFEVVGQVTYADNTTGSAGSAFTWTKTSASTPGVLTPLNISSTESGLGDTNGGEFSLANGVDSSGLVVGQSSVKNGDFSTPHAFVYDPGSAKMYDLGTEQPSVSTAASVANAINGAGTIIVGQSDTDAGNPQAFIYSGYSFSGLSGGTDTQLNGTFTPLGALDGTGVSTAAAINTAGDVVGTSSDGTDALGDVVNHAFIYLPGPSAAIQDLNDSSFVSLPAGYTLDSATGINDLGQITGTADDGSGNTFAYLLTPSPVPEPTAALSIFVAAVAIGSRRSRRR
jgi:probable HAF family extracellular repeat protein